MLLCLSLDLIGLIVQQLPYLSCLALRSTCRTLYSYYDQIRTVSVRAYYKAHPRLRKIPFKDFLDAQLHSRLVFTPDITFEVDEDGYEHPPQVPIRTLYHQYHCLYTLDHDGNLYCDDQHLVQEEGDCTLDDTDIIFYDGKKLTLYVDQCRSYVGDVPDVLIDRVYLIHRKGGNIFEITDEGLVMLKGDTFARPIRDFAVAFPEKKVSYAAVITDDYKLTFLTITADGVKILYQTPENILQVLALRHDFILLHASGTLVFVYRQKPVDDKGAHVLPGKYHTIQRIGMSTKRHDILAHADDYADQITITYEPFTMKATRLDKRFGISLTVPCGTYKVVY